MYSLQGMNSYDLYFGVSAKIKIKMLILYLPFASVFKDASQTFLECS